MENIKTEKDFFLICKLFLDITFYMMLSSNLRYLVWLEQNDWKHLALKT